MSDLAEADDVRVETLRSLPSTYWRPDAEVVSRLKKTYKNKKTGQEESYELDYVGHADLTRALCEIDPEWDWEPLAFNDDGLPLILCGEQEWVLWGRLTILGKTRICVGNCEAGKHDAEKELIGDLLRNGAMRFGIYGGLWSKAGAKAAPPRDRSRTIPSGAAAAAQFDRIERDLKALGITELRDPFVSLVLDELPPVLSNAQASKVIDALIAAKKGVWPQGWINAPAGNRIDDGTEPFLFDGSQAER